MNALKTYLAGLSTGAILLAIAGGLFLAGDFQELRHLRAEQTRPRELEQTAATGKAPEKSVPCPAGGLLAPDLTKKADDKLRAKYGKQRPASASQSPNGASAPLTTDQAAALDGAASAPADGGDIQPPASFLSRPASAPPADVILGEFAVPRAPYGGAELATLEADRRLHLTFKANPTPYLEWPNELGATAMAKLAPQVLDEWRLGAYWEPIRVGRSKVRVEGGALHFAGETRPYIWAGTDFCLRGCR